MGTSGSADMSTTSAADASVGHDIGWLEFVKGFAMFWIIWDHINGAIFGALPIAEPTNDWPPVAERLSQLQPLVGHGFWNGPLTLFQWIGSLGIQGVQLFLIASGFGLTWSLLRHSDGEPEWRGYYVRRFWRIYPMWWVAHVVMLALGIIGVQGIAIDPARPGVWASLMGLRIGSQQMYVFAASWWFVGMIMQFYAVFPIFYWIFKRWGWQRFLAILLPVGIMVRALGLWVFDVPLAGAHYLDAWAHGAIFLSRVPEFVLGMALAGALCQDPLRVQRLLSARSLLVGAVVIYLPAQALSLMVVGNALSSVLVALCNLILVRTMAIAAERWLPPLASAMRWCAVHSLSLCLVNSVVINLMIHRGTLPDPAQVLAAVTAIIVAALALEWLTRAATRLATRHLPFARRSSLAGH